jgi:hypothetical protein
LFDWQITIIFMGIFWCHWYYVLVISLAVMMLIVALSIEDIAIIILVFEGCQITATSIIGIV